MTVRTWLFAPVVFLLGCSDAEPDTGQQDAVLQERMTSLASHLVESALSAQDHEASLKIRLAFDGDVDLDLYVTDPQMETVYFANHESKSGGEISDDLRCGGEGIRVEEISFVAPLRGEYRVGVDYPKHCLGLEAAAAHSIHVSYGSQNLAVQGTVELLKFDVIVMAFDFDGTDLEDLARE